MNWFKKRREGKKQEQEQKRRYLEVEKNWLKKRKEEILVDYEKTIEEKLKDKNQSEKIKWLTKEESELKDRIYKVYPRIVVSTMTNFTGETLKSQLKMQMGYRDIDAEKYVIISNLKLDNN